MKKILATLLVVLLFLSSFIPLPQAPLVAQKAHAESCVYYSKDGLGNVRFITGSTGANVRSYAYDPFGNVTGTQGTLTGNRYQFQTQQNDPESGMYYLRARYYDPSTGRFISRDPIKGTLANPQSQNPYQYAYNNPINLGDPSGEQVAQALGIGAGAAFACTLPISGTALVIGGAAIGVGIVAGYLLDKALSPVPQGIVQGGIDVTNNPGMPPGPDWEWKEGKDGKGAWTRGDKIQGTKESLSPDFNNPAHPPHTDYTNPQKQGFRIYPDGTVEPK